MTINEQIKGSLLGLVWGDAFGCPVETWKEWEIQKIYGEYEQFPEKYPLLAIKELNEKKFGKLRPLGLHSDDGQQAMALIQACLDGSGWNLMKWKTILSDGMKERAWRGYGANFKSAVFKMQRGTRPEMAGSSSAGIGAAMRVAPLGAIYRNDLEKLLKVTIESTLCTHGDIRAASYAYAVTYTVAMLINGKTREEIVETLSERVYEAEQLMLMKYKSWSMDISQPHIVSENIKKLFEKDFTDIKEAQKYISELAKPYLQDGFTKAHPNQGFVLTGGLHALFMGLHPTIKPEEALSEIVKIGYDTDTVAAIAGGILGARFGTEWIPSDKFYDKERVLAYSESMITGKLPENIKSFISKEKRLTIEDGNFTLEILKKRLTDLATE